MIPGDLEAAGGADVQFLEHSSLQQKIGEGHMVFPDFLFSLPIPEIPDKSQNGLVTFFSLGGKKKDEGVAQIFDIGSGLHTLRWSYIKDGVETHGADCGWVDEVIWEAESQDESGSAVDEKGDYGGDGSSGGCFIGMMNSEKEPRWTYSLIFLILFFVSIGCKGLITKCGKLPNGP